MEESLKILEDIRLDLNDLFDNDPTVNRVCNIIIGEFKLRNVKDCSTCKHREVSKYVSPCYGCRDNDGYDHFEKI